MNLILVSDIFLAVVALAWLLFASISDLKRREVENWVSFSLLFIAVAVRALVAIFIYKSLADLGLIVGMFVLVVLFFYLFIRETNIWVQVAFAVLLVVVGFSFKSMGYFSSGLIALGIFFILAALLYYGRACGGADVKLLMALAFVFSTSPSFLNFNYYSLFLLNYSELSVFKSSFLFDFVINSLLVGFFYGIIFSIIMAAKNWKSFKISFREANKKIFLPKIICIVLGIASLILAFFERIVLIIAVFFIIIPWLYAFVKGVEQGVLIKKRPWRELSEGDWLVQSIKVGKKILKPSADGLSKADILLIKRAGKKVWIRDGMPYIPVFLLSIIVSLLFGNLFFRILMLLA